MKSLKRRSSRNNKRGSGVFSKVSGPYVLNNGHEVEKVDHIYFSVDKEIAREAYLNFRAKYFPLPEDDKTKYSDKFKDYSPEMGIYCATAANELLSEMGISVLSRSLEIEYGKGSVGYREMFVDNFLNDYNGPINNESDPIII